MNFSTPMGRALLSSLFPCSELLKNKWQVMATYGGAYKNSFYFMTRVRGPHSTTDPPTFTAFSVPSHKDEALRLNDERALTLSKLSECAEIDALTRAVARAFTPGTLSCDPECYNPELPVSVQMYRHFFRWSETHNVPFILDHFLNGVKNLEAVGYDLAVAGNIYGYRMRSEYELWYGPDSWFFVKRNPNDDRVRSEKKVDLPPAFGSCEDADPGAAGDGGGLPSYEQAVKMG